MYCPARRTSLYSACITATIRLTYEIAYRYPSLHFQTPLAVGDAFPDSSEPWFRIVYPWGDTPDQVRGNLTVKRISPAANLIIGEETLVLTEPLSRFPLQVVLETCCRASDLAEGNNDKGIRVSTTIDLITGGPPVVAPIPRIYLPQGFASSFTLPMAAPSGQAGPVAFSTSAASGLVTPVPAVRAAPLRSAAIAS